MRGLWEKAEPTLAEHALLASRNVGLTMATGSESGLEELRAICGADESHEWRFSDLEAVLVRLGKNYCRRKRCSLCLMKEECQNR